VPSALTRRFIRDVTLAKRARPFDRQREYQLTDFSRVHAQTFAARPAPAGERGG
jgi:hypothetical protein